MKRAVVFAHFDKDAIIQDYVIYYLKALRQLCDKLVFVSSNSLDTDEVLKVEGIADYIIAEKHNEYDFGSYKRGFSFLLHNNFLIDVDELIFANDSCYGPFYPLKNIFDEMDSRDCDFWGITKNNFGYRKKFCDFMKKRPHIQSYFMVFKKNVFDSELFKSIIFSVKEQPNKASVISDYEIAITEKLFQKGFRFDTFVDTKFWQDNVTIFFWREIIQNSNMPFIKKSLIDLKNTSFTTVDGFREVISTKSSYPMNLFIMPREIRRTVPLGIKIFVFKILAVTPALLRKLFLNIVNYIFPFVKD